MNINIQFGIVVPEHAWMGGSRVMQKGCLRAITASWTNQVAINRGSWDISGKLGQIVRQQHISLVVVIWCNCMV